jgi:hypothetical protein
MQDARLDGLYPPSMELRGDLHLRLLYPRQVQVAQSGGNSGERAADQSSRQRVPTDRFPRPGPAASTAVVAAAVAGSAAAANDARGG